MFGASFSPPSPSSGAKLPFVCEYFFVLSGPPVSAVGPCVVPGRSHRARGCPCMFGRVVLTQAGISPKQPGFSRDIWDGNCGTPSLALAPVPSVEGSAGPGPARRGICFAGSLSPHPLLLLWHHQFPLSKIPLDFVLRGLGAQIQPPNPWGWRGCSFPVSWPWRRTGCWLSWPWRRWPRVGFLSPLIPGAGGSCSFPVSQPWRRRPRAGCWLPQPQGGGQGLEVAPVSLWHRHVWMSRSQVPSSL